MMTSRLTLFVLVSFLLSCSTTKLAEVDDAAIKEIQAHQEELNEFYRNPQTSPLKEKATGFSEHQFYPINLTYRVQAKVNRLKNEPFFEIPTSGTKTPEYRRFALLDFELGGKSYQLTVLQNKDNMMNPLYRNRLFLPFQDHTNGDLTYGGGRYIDLKIPTGDHMILDFNQSYHPYCAYTDGYNCPIPPAENRMDVAIEAGIILNDSYKH